MSSNFIIVFAFEIYAAIEILGKNKNFRVEVNAYIP